MYGSGFRVGLRVWCFGSRVRETWQEHSHAKKPTVEFTVDYDVSYSPDEELGASG